MTSTAGGLCASRPLFRASDAEKVEDVVRAIGEHTAEWAALPA